MFDNHGLMPARRLYALTACTALLCAAAPPAAAQHTQPETVGTALLTIGEAEDLALAGEPGRAALAEQSLALKARAASAGALPAPTLGVEINNFPIESGGFSTEGMTNAGISVRQAFPPGNTLDYTAGRFEALADAANLKGQDRERAIRLAVRQAWFDVHNARRAASLLRESRPLFDDLATVTRSLYAVGSKSQQDALRADIELSRLDERLIEYETRAAEAEADLSQWVGRHASRPLPDALPKLRDVPGPGALELQLEQHPRLRAVDAEIDSKDAAAAIAAERTKPGWAINLGYRYREGNLRPGRPRSDFISMGITMDMPFFRKRSVDNNLRAALGEKTAAASERKRVARELTAELYAAFARWRELGRRAALYEERILEQTAAHAEAALLAYQSETADFADVMQARIAFVDARIEYLKLETERARSHATLAYLGGF